MRKPWTFEGQTHVHYEGEDYVVRFRATLDAHHPGYSPEFEFEALAAGLDLGDETHLSQIGDPSWEEEPSWPDLFDFQVAAYDATFTAYMAAKEHAEGMALCEDDLRERA